MNASTNLNLPLPTLSSAIKRHWKKFAIFGFIGAAMGMGIALTIPQQWSATLLFQVGQVGSNSNLLATPDNVIQHVKFPGFVDQVLQSQKLPTGVSVSGRSDVIKKTLTASLEKGSSLIKMSVRGNTPEQAEENLAAAFQLLQSEHALLLTPSVTKYKKNLEDATASLARAQDEKKKILESVNKAGISDNTQRKFYDSIVLTSMLTLNDSEMRILRDQINSLDEVLSPYRTFNTKMVTSVYVPVDAVSTGKGIALVSGVLLGWLIAAILALLTDNELLAAARAALDSPNEIV
ncbi:hypothetical protein [Collimonas pratensis]|uniref:Chain length determinant family protein n=1 Tax=Collimonas pratensis TaxID=279113 RepID=A0ABN4MGE3_9BURK|nr:hypothetical protein [Collimonas pratensis]AMP14677.1 chain length determinant family protein [Collimonas pratensis]